MRRSSPGLPLCSVAGSGSSSGPRCSASGCSSRPSCPRSRDWSAGVGAADVQWLAPAVRPFGHAAYVAALTYALVAEAGRSSVAGLVLLGCGAFAAFLSLAHARDVLRGERPRFELPSADAFAARLGASLPAWSHSDVRVEIVALALAVTGAPGLPWGVLVGAALARLWAVVDRAERVSEPSRDEVDRLDSLETHTSVIKSRRAVPRGQRTRGV